MAGKIIADTIESAGSQISLNVGNVTVLTASSSGLTLTPTNNVNINVTNCTGNITIEASLATTPSSTDWFKVYELSANANAAANSAPQIASNASVYTNINGNFVYMRAKVVDFEGGVVNFVKLSY
jgi:hypothetical protein